MLLHVIFQFQNYGESFFASSVEAFEDSWRLSIVLFQVVHERKFVFGPLIAVAALVMNAFVSLPFVHLQIVQHFTRVRAAWDVTFERPHFRVRLFVFLPVLFQH